MSDFRLSPKQLRALVLLLLLLPLVPTAIMGRAMIVSAIEETRQVRELVSTFREDSVAALVKLVVNRLDTKEIPAFETEGIPTPEAIDQLELFLTHYMPVRVLAPDGSLISGPTKSPIFGLQIDGGQFVPGGTIEFPFKIGAHDRAIALTQIRTSFLVTGLTLAGVLVATILVGWTITRQLKIEELKSDFLATVSHELKTPIASSRLLLETLEEKTNGRDPQQIEEYTALLLQENERMGTLVTNFLTHSRLHSGSLEISPSSLSPKDILTSAAAEIQPRIDHVGGELETDAPSDLPAVTADRHALQNILTCLLENAIAHGGNQPEVSLSATAAKNGVRIIVKDRGPGIPREHRERIFEPFYQVDQKLSRRRGGCGLGLSIAQNLLRAQGSELHYQQPEGGGSEFSFTLPSSSVQPA